MTGNQDVIKEVLIGKKVKILANNKKFEGLVLDETKETITLLDQEEKTILKTNMRITEINGKRTNIDGNKIKEKPYERIRLK